MNTPTNSEALPLTNCSALAILQGCGLHGGYYNTIEKAAEGVRDIIRALRADLHDPPHDIQCAVLRKLGVEGFTKEGVAPTHQLIPLPNAKHHRRRLSASGACVCSAFLPDTRYIMHAPPVEKVFSLMAWTIRECSDLNRVSIASKTDGYSFPKAVR